MRVFVKETGLATYPDLCVVCGTLETAAEDKDAIVNPVLLAEVLSPSTEAWDRGGKAAHYRRIPSLREILFVSPDGRLREAQHLVAHQREEALDDPTWVAGDTSGACGALKVGRPAA